MRMYVSLSLKEAELTRQILICFLQFRLRNLKVNRDRSKYISILSALDIISSSRPLDTK